MQTPLTLLVLAIFVAISSWGCSTSDPSGGRGNDGGAGASMSTGGTSGGGGAGGVVFTGGNGGAGGSALLPPCLQTLFASCPTSGACQFEAPSTTSNRTCFANGARTENTRTDGCDGTGRTVSRVYKADGSLCYTKEVKVGLVCESEHVTWTDATDVVIATGDARVGENSVACASGETGTCTRAQCSLGSVWGGPPGPLCEAGTCP